MTRSSYLTSKAFRLYLGSSILTALSTMIGNIVNGVIVSHFVDHNAMSAVNLGRPLLQFHYTIYQLFGLGACILTGYALGKDEHRQANKLFTLAITFLAIYAFVGTAVGIICPSVVNDFLCKNPDIYDMAMEYTQVMLITTPIFLAMLFLGAFTSLDGNPRLVSRAMIADNVLNLLLSLFFVGVLKMGVMGCAIAFATGHALAVTLMGAHWLRKPEARNLKIVKITDGDNTKNLTQIIKTGYPFAIASICLTIYLWAANTMIQNALGKDGLYVFSVVLSLLTFYNFFVTGTCQTLQSLGAVQMGQGDVYGLRLSVKSAFRFVTTALAISCTFLWIMPDPVCSLFDCPDNLRAECHYAIRIYAFAFALFIVLYLLMVNYKLLKNTVLSTFISFALSLMVIPVFYVTTNWCLDLVWWSNLIAYALVFLIVILISIFYQRRDKNLSFITLLPISSPNPALDLSIGYAKPEVAKATSCAKSFLKEHDIDDTCAMKACLCMEELLLNIVESQKEKVPEKKNIDVRVVIDKDVTVSIHDDNKPFDPVHYDGETGYGLQIIRGICTNIQYKYMYGQNMTTCTINK